MQVQHKLLCLSGLLTFGLLTSTAASAATVMVNLGTIASSATNTGTFTNQAEVLEENFTLSSASNLTAFTTSYGGGTNLNGSSTPVGGFQPSLILFNGTGNYVAGETYPSPIANTDATTHWALDSYLSASSLSAGNYTLVLTDWLNQQSPTATNLSDGFTFNLGSGGSSFVDAQGNMRTANYALNLSVSPVSSTATPEPASFWLVAPAIAGLLLVVRRRRCTQQQVHIVS